jgi:hypothetical protein
VHQRMKQLKDGGWKDVTLNIKEDNMMAIWSKSQYNTSSLRSSSMHSTKHPIRVLMRQTKASF